MIDTGWINRRMFVTKRVRETKTLTEYLFMVIMSTGVRRRGKEEIKRVE